MSASSIDLHPDIVAVRAVRTAMADELHRMVSLLDRLDLLLDGDPDLEDGADDEETHDTEEEIGL